MDFPVAEAPTPIQRPAELIQIEGMRGRTLSDEAKQELNSSGMRYKAIRQEALRVGAQSGLAMRYESIMDYLAGVETKMNVVFSFNGFVEGGRLLIPAVVEVPDQFVMDEGKGQARVIRQAYTIEEEARIVSSAPTWREYLWQKYAYPEMPHESLLPRTDAESVIWTEGVRSGWAAGVEQGTNIYKDRLARLTVAVEGRHLYKMLEAKNMVSPAALKVLADSKVTFNGRTMNVGEVIYGVGSRGEYLPSKEWAPVWTK